MAMITSPGSMRVSDLGFVRKLPSGSRSASTSAPVRSRSALSPMVEPALTEVSRVLGSGGRFLAAERRTTPGATGLASHGWTDAQAEAFADLCRAAGFVDVTVATHPGKRALVSVLAHRPSASP